MKENVLDELTFNMWAKIYVKLLEFFRYTLLKGILM